MKQATIKKFEKLAKLTGRKCAECPSLAETFYGEQVPGPYRCCDKLFCNLVESRLPDGVIYEKPNIGDIPYMGEAGCVVAPHHRPFCTAFVCAPHLERDRTFRRQYESLVRDINDDEEAPAIKEVVRRNTI